MSLFVDGSISGISDLLAHDVALLRVASSEGVDIPAKQDLATAELRIGIEEFLARRTGRPEGGAYPSRITIEQVVATAPLKHWHALQTLALVYDDISGNHVDSRYGAKHKDYSRRAGWAAQSLYRTGVGLVYSPIPRAGKPEVRVISGTLPAAAYCVQVAWRTQSGDGGALGKVLIEALTQDGTIGVRVSGAPDAVDGFDVYAGGSADSVTKQNSGIVAVGEEWVMPAGGLIDGEGPPAGQSPDFYLHNDRILQRG